MGHIILRLDRVMADRKMSLNELSARVGVANVNLSKMKNGHISAIRFSTLAAICDVLKCQPGDILEYSPEEKSNIFPVFFNEQELYELDWDNESTVESVLLMRRAKR